KDRQKPLKIEGLTKIRKTFVLLAQCNFDLLIKCYGEVEVHFTEEKMAAKLLHIYRKDHLTSMRGDDVAMFDWNQISPLVLAPLDHSNEIDVISVYKYERPAALKDSIL
ncbi:hypothetical protein QYM36_001809, partial [Artemia franciscana]